MTRVIQFHALLAALLIMGSTIPAHGQFSELVRRVPEGANAIILFDVNKVYASPIGQREGWADNHHEAFQDGLISLPPDAARFVLASKIDIEFMKPIWDVALVDLNRSPSMQEAAERLNGTIDRVAGHPAISLPSDTYVVSFSEQSFGAMSPGNRQDVARWVRDFQTRTSSVLPPYLANAARYVMDVGTPVILAIDARDVLTPAHVEQRLKELDTFKGSDVDHKELASLLSSIRGVTLGITFRQQPFGSIKVDFEQETSPLADYAKPLILEVLANRGALIEDFEKWEAQVADQHISIRGNLSESALRRIFSLIDAPLSFAHAAQSPADAAGQERADNTPAAVSKRYFDSVQSLLEDLHGKKGTANNLNMYGVWFDRYAQKVARLPTLNVDEELLAYGQFIESALRQASMAVKQRGMRSRVRQVNAVADLPGGEARNAAYDGVGWVGGYSGGYRYGRYGAYGGYEYGGYYQRPGAALNQDLREQQSVRTQIRTQEKVNMAANVTQIVEQIKAASSDIRRKMTQKYQTQF